MKIKLGDREVEADQVDIVSEAEPANEYTLADGAVVRLKTVAHSVYKIRGEKDQDGNPVYYVRSQNIVTLGRAPR